MPYKDSKIFQDWCTCFFFFFQFMLKLLRDTRGCRESDTGTLFCVVVGAREALVSFLFKMLPKSDARQLNQSLLDRPDKPCWEMTSKSVLLVLDMGFGYCILFWHRHRHVRSPLTLSNTISVKFSESILGTMSGLRLTSSLQFSDLSRSAGLDRSVLSARTAPDHLRAQDMMVVSAQKQASVAWTRFWNSSLTS